MAALGSINQYNVAKSLEKAGLDPVKDVQWIVNVGQPDLMKMLGQKQVDVTDLAYQFGTSLNKTSGARLLPLATRSQKAARLLPTWLVAI